MFSVFERAMAILPHLKVFVDNVNQKSIKNPGTKSYDIVKELCKK